VGSQVSTSMHELQPPLLTPDECLRMPGPQKNERDLITAGGDMVVYCAGFPAIYGRQPLYFQDPTFVARAAIGAPPYRFPKECAGSAGRNHLSPLLGVSAFWPQCGVSGGENGYCLCRVPRSKHPRASIA
jgi:hypothetical protein